MAGTAGVHSWVQLVAFLTLSLQAIYKRHCEAKITYIESFNQGQGPRRNVGQQGKVYAECHAERLAVWVCMRPFALIKNYITINLYTYTIALQACSRVCVCHVY